MNVIYLFNRTFERENPNKQDPIISVLIVVFENLKAIITFSISFFPRPNTLACQNKHLENGCFSKLKDFYCKVAKFCYYIIHDT